MPEASGSERPSNPTWTLSGAGFDKLTLLNRPLPEITDDQVLARREICTICFSSVKEILSGADHPRLHDVDFQNHPVVLGDEAFLVLEKVGANLRGRFQEGKGYAMAPDYGDGVSAFGYNQDGGLTRYGVLEGTPLDYLIPADDEAVARVGMYAISLSEPVGCHEKSCTLQYRSAVMEGGKLLVLSDSSPLPLKSSAAFNPATAVTVNAGGKVKAFIDSAAAREGFEVRHSEIDDPVRLKERFAPGGWDDILVVSSDQRLLARASRDYFATLARGGVMAILAPVAKATSIELELGTYHYDDTLIVGSPTGDVARAYTENTDFGIKPGSTVVYLGAGGPMGQVGILWLASLGDEAPGRVVAVDLSDARLSRLGKLAAYLPEHTSFETHNASSEKPKSFLDAESIDCLFVLAPSTKAVEAYAPFLAPWAIVNLFAGLRNKYAAFDAHDIVERHVRLVGHSGNDVRSQTMSLEKILDGRIVTDPIVAAVGGMDAAADGLQASHMGTFPGKICIDPGCRHKLVEVGKLTGGAPWSPTFERAFLKDYPW